MTDKSGCAHAMILSGGGANGAYEVGVLKALLCGEAPVTDNVPLDPDIVTGTSIGAYNASLLVAGLADGPKAALDRLQDVWLNLIPRDNNTGHNHVLRYRANPLDLLSPKYVATHPVEPYSKLAADLYYLAKDFYRRGLTFLISPGEVETRLLKLVDLSILISNDPEYRLIKDTINFEVLRRSHKILKIAVTNWSTGELEIFEKADLTDEVGPKAIMASTAIPGIFPQVQLDGEYYADGGVVMNTPLSPAIQAGADILHMVYLDPDVKSIPLLPVVDAVDTFSRYMTIGFAAAVNNDIETARQINKGIDVLERAASGDALSQADLQPFILAAGKLAAVASKKKYKKLVIHKYQPRDTLGGLLGMFNFSRDRIFDLIDRGFQDTINHSCEESGCVV
jgi:predicted acylesterase/phospholipase RssA